MSADGISQHAGDVGAQLTMSLDNVEAILQAAGMALSNVVRLNIYTTDVDAFFEVYGLLAERLGGAGITPPGCLRGVSRLAFPELILELGRPRSTEQCRPHTQRALEALRKGPGGTSFAPAS